MYRFQYDISTADLWSTSTGTCLRPTGWQPFWCPQYGLPMYRSYVSQTVQRSTTRGALSMCTSVTTHRVIDTTGKKS